MNSERSPWRHAPTSATIVIRLDPEVEPTKKSSLGLHGLTWINLYQPEKIKKN